MAEQVGRAIAGHRQRLVAGPGDAATGVEREHGARVAQHGVGQALVLDLARLQLRHRGVQPVEVGQLLGAVDHHAGVLLQATHRIDQRFDMQVADQLPSGSAAETHRGHVGVAAGARIEQRAAHLGLVVVGIDQPVKQVAAHHRARNAELVLGMAVGLRHHAVAVDQQRRHRQVPEQGAEAAERLFGLRLAALQLVGLHLQFHLVDAQVLDELGERGVAARDRRLGQVELAAPQRCHGTQAHLLAFAAALAAALARRAAGFAAAVYPVVHSPSLVFSTCRSVMNSVILTWLTTAPPPGQRIGAACSRNQRCSVAE